MLQQVNVSFCPEEVKGGFLNLETIETWIMYVYHSRGEWARQKM
jgi:hypothetical protein